MTPSASGNVGSVSGSVAATFTYDKLDRLRRSTNAYAGVESLWFAYSASGQYDERLFAAAGIAGLQGPFQNWHRWYLPTMGRYMELDPIAADGGFSGSGWAPDWYSYVSGNPLTYVDPMGLDRISICLAKKLFRLMDDDGNERMRADVVTGCKDTPTPTGKYKLGDWYKDLTTPRWGEDSKRKWSEDFWGRNVFGPWFVPLQRGKGVGIHGHYGPFSGGFGFWLGKRRSPCSHGCIRMSNDNITLLHDLLPKPFGTPVDIMADCE